MAPAATACTCVGLRGLGSRRTQHRFNALACSHPVSTSARQSGQSFRGRPEDLIIGWPDAVIHALTRGHVYVLHVELWLSMSTG